LDVELPEEREAVGFFARRTAKAPAPESFLISCQYLASKARDHLLLKDLKDSLVSVEPRYGDPAEGLQHGPFFRMEVEVGFIIGERLQPKRLKASPDPRIDLASHLAVAGPTEPEPW